MGHQQTWYPGDRDTQDRFGRRGRQGYPVARLFGTGRCSDGLAAQGPELGLPDQGSRRPEAALRAVKTMAKPLPWAVTLRTITYQFAKMKDSPAGRLVV